MIYLRGGNTQEKRNKERTAERSSGSVFGLSGVKLGQRALRDPLQHLFRENSHQLPADVQGFVHGAVFVSACEEQEAEDNSHSSKFHFNISVIIHVSELKTISVCPDGTWGRRITCIFQARDMRQNTGQNVPNERREEGVELPGD